jgi:hypothetical protein
MPGFEQRLPLCRGSARHALVGHGLDVHGHLIGSA